MPITPFIKQRDKRTKMDNGASSYNRFLNGDNKALDEIVVLYSDALVGFALCIVGDVDVAEDIAADTFACLVVKRKKFAEEAAFKAYLFKIARNKCMDYLRASAKIGHSFDFEQLVGGNAETDVLKRERDRLLYSALAKLPNTYRDVLHLTYFEGFSIDEIRKIMKKNTKQVYNLMSRAKSSLKKILIKEGIDGEII